ncbi:hypothetical protein [Pseudomonas proteolytica]|uniref:hypothetical protein n=1 Tax=Pseudomonas proteolytica TaxID=219574 RepID=UPI000A8DDBAE|nr:hypothetical protein [Pseudomonas proteolytica]MBC3336765.1 hypothetical protein [Pseudomonas proteolytica]MDF3159944.1 hypothetical protein [Pseudomonas proteolytica]NMZ36410.1 hypothetical protein [Pseudomonas proteolytica]
MKGLIDNKSAKGKKAVRALDRVNTRQTVVDPRIVRALLEGVDEPQGVLAGRK